jgi:Flagellar hook-length control protein FliK
MSIVITPNVSLTAAHGAAAPVVLQSGSVISARVQQVLSSDTVRIAIAGQSINVQSQVPLQAGQTLQLAVSQSNDGTIRLAVVNQQPASQAPGAAANPTVTTGNVALAPDTAAIAAQPAPAVASNIQLTPQQAVTAAVQTAVTQQNGLAPLFANLSVATLIDSLPPQVLQAVAQVLAQQTSLDQTLTGADIKQAFQSSGLFLEASLATGSVSSTAATPDLKAALIVLRQVLTTSLNSVTATSTAPATVAPQSATPTATTVAPQPTAPATTPPPTPATTTTLTGLPAAAATAVAALIQQAPAAAVASVLVAQPAAGTTTAAVAQQATAAAAAVVQQEVQSAVAFPQQSVPATVAPQTPATVSPTLVPDIAVATALLQTAAPVAPDILNLAVANAVILPPSAPANAAALTAASSAAINLLQEAVQSTPLLLINSAGLLSGNNQMLALVPAVGGLARPSMVDEAEFAHTNMPPPPLPGAVPTAQPVLPATLLSNSPAESAMHRLLADTDAAIARQTLLQVASLPDRVDPTAPRLDQQGPRWNFEIPFATPRGTAMAQFEISRDGGGNEVEAAKRVWRARFSLDVEPSGPIHALVSLSGERTSVRMWAERPATAAQLRAGASQLSQALSKAELTPGDIVIRDGTPPQSAPARAGHFLDRAL